MVSGYIGGVRVGLGRFRRKSDFDPFNSKKFSDGPFIISDDPFNFCNLH